MHNLRTGTYLLNSQMTSISFSFLCFRVFVGTPLLASFVRLFSFPVEIQILGGTLSCVFAPQFLSPRFS